MSQLTKNQLGTENSNSFPNNNTGYITPTLLRTFNQNMIDSLVDEDSYTVESGSFNARINALDPSGSAQSILALNQFTASQYVSNSLFIQSSQTSSMSVLSSSFAQTASYALNTQNIDTGSLVTTSSFNSYTASASTNVSASINAATSSLSASLTLTVNGKLNTGSFNTYTSSNDSKVNELINKTGSYATTGSNTFVGNQIVSGNLNVSGNITATSASFQYVQTIYETASVIYSSGSNQFGDASDDTQTLFGRVDVKTGPLVITGSTFVSGNITLAQGSDLVTHHIKAAAVNGVEIQNNSGNTAILVGAGGSLGTTFYGQINTTAISSSGNITGNLIGTASFATSASQAITASFALNAGASVDTGSFATTGSNNFIGNQTITGSLTLSSSADVELNIIGNTNLTGSLLVTGGFNAKVAFPSLNVTNNILQSTGSIIVAQDIVRSGGGANDVASLRLQARTGSAGAGDALTSTISAQNNLNTTTFLSASAVASLQATFSTGSGGGTVGYNAGLTATAQSGSAISVLSGNTIRLGTSAANVITSTGSFGPMTLVGPLNQPVFAIRSGSFEVTTPQGSGSFYTNLPITSSGMRLNGDARFSGIEVVGLVGANGSGSIAVEKNVIVSGSIIISGSGTLTLTGSYAGNLGFSGSVISNLGSIYTASNAIRNIVNIGSASYSQLSSSALVDINTLYIVEGGDSYLLSSQTSSFATTGSNTFKASQTISGSVYGEVKALSISSTTASLDLSIGNFFTLQLVSGAATNINPTNIRPGQTINIRLNTTGSGTVTFPSSVKQISGSAYTPTTTTGVDVITLIAFDTTNLYLASVKNLI